MESDRERPVSRWTGAVGVGLTAGLAGALCLAASSLLGSLLQPNNLGWSGLVRMATLVIWPWSDDGHPLPNFLVALGIVLLVPVLLISPAAREIPGGRAGYTMMWATWGAVLVAGALAGAAAVIISAAGSPGGSGFDVLPSGLQAGAGWALLVGWIPALIAAGVHAGRLRQSAAD